ncbi:LytR C-terminal domain-containing protein [Solirubrobacter phytolaccae]|uniref:LytR C-terminal domain-containing protein n=1 Tax=Solirubrobacter phytolaccae TaxID=1404360 RepID=A0A9X3NE28_9ACTN|nr:LytR C-terminal domain-containing protein [Solirubrobacter phytolaccae]MDA0183519.1 LytR C-terminal domain-containing protein [Solirubrobacter phytolaccae]
MVFLAFSLQEQVEKYGAYIGIAAFFGLAVLTLLYFAQAREVKRLREWAGRAPERAAELEYAVAEHAQQVRQAPVAQPVAAQPQRVAQAQPVVAAPANGTAALKPEEVAALAFARAAGVHDPHEPKPHPVPAAALATAAAPPTQTVADVPPAPLPSTTNGGGYVPPPATPAARRVEPLPPRRTQQPPPRRGGAAAPPPRRDSSTRGIVIGAILAVLVIAAVGYGFTKIGGDGEQAVPPNPTANPTAEAGAESTPEATAEPGVTKEDAQIVVFNATSTTGLAGTYKTMLTDEGYPEGNIEAATLGEAAQTTTSTVMYARGDKAAAQGVADVLGIDRVEQLSEAIQGESSAVEQGREWNVVAIVGQDKSTG